LHQRWNHKVEVRKLIVFFGGGKQILLDFDIRHV
jgi:hypothetical protein